MADKSSDMIALGEAYVDDYLAHYSSPYYDPGKAHAYYEEHKKLSDKAKKTALTSQKQRDVFAVEQEQIAAAKAKEVTGVQTKTKAELKQLHDTAQATVDQISSTLKALAQSLKNAAAAPTLNVIPKDATPQQRAFLEKQNATLKANAKKDANNKYSQSAGQAARDRAKVTGALSRALNDAGNDYTNKINALNAKYTQITAHEKAKIKKEVSGVDPKLPKKKH